MKRKQVERLVGWSGAATAAAWSVSRSARKRSARSSRLVAMWRHRSASDVRRVSRYGAMGLSWTMDKIGPICRGVEDCAAALHAIYGPDGKDITVGDAPFNWNPDTNISTLRIGYLKTEFDGQRLRRERAQRPQAEQRARSTKTRSTCWKKRREADADRAAEILSGSLRFILSAKRGGV
jgi:Asp-tRNA(Asn)/Glu-tRNA(Gln) amidotransferase A subunit family amidase